MTTTEQSVFSHCHINMEPSRVIKAPALNLQCVTNVWAGR